MPMQYTATFKNDNSQIKNLAFFLCSLNEAVLKITSNLYFRPKIRKKYTPVNRSFTLQKWGARGYTLYGCVSMVTL